jgi:hypothetical protein
MDGPGRLDVFGAVDLMMVISTCGVEAPFDAVLGFIVTDQPELAKRWRARLETVYECAGKANRAVLEHGMAHEQTYSGNIRYLAGQGDEMSATLCDWHDCHDLLSMPYVQAFGYAALAMKNLLMPAKDTQQRGLMSIIRPDLAGAAMRGFIAKPRSQSEQAAIPSDLVEAALADVYNIPQADYNTDNMTDLELAFGATAIKPAAEIPIPAFQLLGIIYSPQKHRELVDRYVAST